MADESRDQLTAERDRGWLGMTIEAERERPLRSPAPGDCGLVLAHLENDPDSCVVFLDESGNPPGGFPFFAWAALSFPTPGAAAHALKINRKQAASYLRSKTRRDLGLAVHDPLPLQHSEFLKKKQKQCWKEFKFSECGVPVELVERWGRTFVECGGTACVVWMSTSDVDFSQTRYRDPHRAHYLIAAELLTEFVAKGQRCVVVADDYDEKNGIVWHRDLLEAANSSDGPRVTAVVPTSSACSDLIQLCDLFSSAVARKLRKPEASVGGPRERYIAALEAGLGLNAGSILKGGNGLTVHEYHPTTR